MTENLDMHLKWSYLDGNNEEVGPITSSELMLKRANSEVTNHTIVRLWESNWTTIQEASVCLSWAESKPTDLYNYIMTPSAPIYWSYIDCYGNEQGPVSNEYIMHHYSKGWFSDHTRVRLWPIGWNYLQLCLAILPTSENDTGWVDCANSDTQSENSIQSYT